MNRYIHFIGIGGIGMSGIAQILLRKGISVSGSDIKESEIVRALRQLGAKIYIGHHSRNIAGADLVVYSSAIKADNPELREANRLNIRTIKRAEALAELMDEETIITVSGAHGKTTTATLVSHILLKAGLYPTAIIGGVSRNWESNACLGQGKFLVIEADESDGSFLYYRPDYSIITNIDYEHLDYYKDFSNLLATFKEFIARTKDKGCLFGYYDDKNISSILRKSNRKHILFGLTEEADIYPRNIIMKELTSEFDCTYKGKALDRFKLLVAGEHNIINSLAAIGVAIEMGIDLEVIKEALATYLGTQRRLQVKYNLKDILVIDDYAHHPTEIKATLKAVSRLGYRRVIAVFQPHRYTRTQLLLDEFTKCFDSVDEVIITDIYPAGEEPIKGIDAKRLYEKLKTKRFLKVDYLARQEIVEGILDEVKGGDLIVTLGAGDIGRIADELAEKLKRKN
jgi:UDP-N-acetylmuramate--alanine ligase